jgi:hypothetical protein
MHDYLVLKKEGSLQGQPWCVCILLQTRVRLEESCKELEFITASTLAHLKPVVERAQTARLPVYRSG